LFLLGPARKKYAAAFFMQFTKRSIEKFRHLYLKIFDEELSDDEARQKAEYLIGVYRTVYGMPDFEKHIDNKIEEKE
jgi:hypothetical protein